MDTFVAEFENIPISQDELTVLWRAYPDTDFLDLEKFIKERKQPEVEVINIEREKEKWLDG